MNNWKKTIPNQPIPTEDVDDCHYVWAFEPERPEKEGRVYLCPASFARIGKGVTHYQPTGLKRPEEPKEY